MKFINLTPHDITVAGTVFPASGTVARIATATTSVGNLGRFRLNRNTIGSVQNLPEPTEDTIYIVSGMVLDACKGRGDVVAPDTGPDAVRNDKGHIVEVLGFLAPRED